MKGTIQIAKFANIPVLLHWSFGLILAWVLYLSYSSGSNMQMTLWLLAFVLSLFVCVVLHEYGHALTAKRFGVNTRDIILSPIGGVARLEHLPEKPMHEFYIAVAGPLVNVCIALVLSPYFLLEANGLESLYAAFNADGDAIGNPFRLFIPALIGINLVLATFNMLPAFPMDGGRVLRALLSIKIGRTKATKVASRLGQTVAFGFLFLGIYNLQPITALIGVFVFFAASSEYSVIKANALLQENTVRTILRPLFTKIRLSDTMQHPIDLLQSGKENSFLVYSDDHIVGVLHQEFIVQAIKDKAFDAPVQEFVSPRFEYATPDMSLKKLLQWMQLKGYSILPVVEERQVIGVADRKGLQDFINAQRKIRFR